jgi:hypothetical protein
MTKSYRSLIHLRKGIQIKAESFVTMTTDGKCTISLFSGKKSIKLGIQKLEFFHGPSLVLPEIQEHLGLVENSGNWTGLVLAHDLPPSFFERFSKSGDKKTRVSVLTGKQTEPPRAARFIP